MRGSIGASSAPKLIKRFWFQTSRLAAYFLLFPILTHPRLPALARCGVPPGEGECRYVGIRNFASRLTVAGHQADVAAPQGCAVHTIEDVAFSDGAVFGRYGHVAAVIECSLKCLANVLVRS